MEKEIRFGILGLGRIAKKFAEALEKANGARLAGVGSRSLDKAKAFAEGFPSEHVFGSYQELIQSPDIDAIYIATPHTSHCENTIQCLENKKAVLCEKPFAMNAKEVQKMISSSKKHKTFLMEAFWTRFIPSFLKAKELVTNGEIGEIISIQADFGFRANFNPEHRLFNKSLGGGSLLDVGIYPVFFATHFLGEPKKIIASAKIGDTGVDEQLSVLLEYSSGKRATLTSSIVSNNSVEANIFGSKKRIRLNGEWHCPTNISLFADRTNFENIDFDYNGRNGYEYEIEEVVKCLREGKTESDLLTHSDSQKLIRVLDNIRKEINLVYPDHD
ncbi:Gfo/Idh/MocA family protein [Flexithrix dorotheae]|uniref:Gfo/Idh/MocA family protein n=1 Tax=Flexithrix dorotheae TaxID=70993 RepID=UPI00036B8064|nr:Gfo/Idh/MocA family oxidoreductase [Flexithrix dorotheae]